MDPIANAQKPLMLTCVYPRAGGGGWGTPIFSYIRRLEPFLGFKILIFNIFFWGGGVQKNDIFGGMMIVWIFFVWGSHKTGLVLGVFSMHFRVFGGHHKTRLVLRIISMHFRVFP